MTEKTQRQLITSALHSDKGLTDGPQRFATYLSFILGKYYFYCDTWLLLLQQIIFLGLCE